MRVSSLENFSCGSGDLVNASLSPTRKRRVGQQAFSACNSVSCVLLGGRSTEVVDVAGGRHGLERYGDGRESVEYEETGVKGGKGRQQTYYPGVRLKV